jgi:predicted O-methyltransferase YrrM
MAESIGERVAGIPGQLRPEDEEELYRLACTTTGPILEIGTLRGRSTTILALGAKEGRGGWVVSVDVDPSAQAAAQTALREHGVADRALLVRGSVVGALRRLNGLRPMLVFVDADHSAEGVGRDLTALEPVVPAGATLVFHDFTDPRNDDPGEPTIGVREAVSSSWVQRDCEQAHQVGACGVFRRREGPDPQAPVLDAVLLDPLRMQWMERVRWPAGKIARRLLGG